MALSPEALVQGSVELASFPRIYVRLNEVLDNPRASASHIADVISEDSGLTARLLRLVNSAFYGFPSRIETVSRAVLVVGTQQIRDLALATSVMSVFRAIPEDLVSMKSFWLHSVTTGVTARVLATYRREANVERFLVAGVLHDVGRLLIYKKLPDQAREALLRGRRTGELYSQAEREVIGFDHAAAGGALLRRWKLPASLEEAAAFHHDPGRASRFPLESALVHVADVLSHALHDGDGGEGAVPPLDAAAWARLQLSTDVLGAALDQAQRQVEAMLEAVDPAGRP